MLLLFGFGIGGEVGERREMWVEVVDLLVVGEG